MSFWLTVAFAAEITVSTTADLSADDGACSLREALAAARDDLPSGSTAGECAAGGSGLDTLRIPSGTYVLGGSELAVDSEVALVGEGEGVTVLDGDASSRVLRVTADASFTDLTVRNGSALVPDRGAGMHVVGVTATLTNVAITDHYLGPNGAADYPEGAGIAVEDGGLDLLYVRFEDNVIEGSTNRWTRGGGLYADDSTVIGSFVEMRNHTCGEAPGRGSEGCGVYAEDGTLTLTDFVFTGMDTGTQQIQYGGAGFFEDTLVELRRGIAYGNVDADYGVFAFDRGEVMLQNVTLTGNTGELEGSLFLDGVEATLDHVTIAGEPGYGLLLDDVVVTLHETVIVDNALGGCFNDTAAEVSVSGAVLQTGFEAQDCSISSGSPMFTDAVTFEALDLSTPYVPTLEPTAGSVLAGASSCLAADGSPLADDARGLVRPASGCTIGAHQLETCGDGAVDAGEMCDDFNATDGDGCSTTCELEANWDCTGDPSVCIWIAAGTTLQVSTTEDVVADDGACSLREALASVRDAEASGASIGECGAGTPGADTIELPSGTYVLGGSELAVDSQVALVGEGEGVTVLDGDASSRVLRVTADASFTDLTVRNGSALVPDRGAGMHVVGVTATLTNVAITDHYLGPNGAADYPEGAGIAVEDGGLDLLYVRFEDNVIEGSTNRWTRGGGLYADDSTVIGSFVEMRNHTCGEAPGRGSEGCGVYAEDGTLTLTDFVFTGMDTGTQQIQYGAAGYFDGTVVELTRGVAYGNVDGGYGVFTFEGGEATLQNVTMTGNTGDFDAGLVLGQVDATLDHVTIAGEPGYGLIVELANVSLHETVIVGNTQGGCFADTPGGFSVMGAVLQTGFEDADCTVISGSPVFTDAVTFEALDLSTPYVPTLEPTAGSVLAGASSCQAADGSPLADDARGLVRPASGCTIGAHQLETCGDGAVDAGEMCDDFNATDGDGCSTTCEVEANWDCTGDPSVCVEVAVTTLEDQVVWMRQAAVSAYDARHDTAIDPITEEKMVSVLQPALDALITGGCVVDPTTEGWIAGAYRKAAVDGEDEGGSLTSLSKVGGTFELLLSSGVGATGQTHQSRQFYGDRDDGGFVVGRWKRVRGKTGIFFGLSGTCSGGQDPRTLLDGWYAGNLE